MLESEDERLFYLGPRVLVPSPSCLEGLHPSVARGRGRVIAPLYRNVPMAAADDPLLYEYLALADTLRIGRARERAMAREELSKRLAS